MLKCGAHMLDGALIAGKRLDACDLREAGGAGVGVGHQASDVRGEIRAHDAVAHAPAGHGVGLGEAVKNDGTFLHAGNGRDGEMLAFKEQAAVNFIREHENVAVADDFGHLLDVFARHDAARGVLRRIENNELGVIGDQRGQLIHVEREVAFLAQLDGYGLAAHVVDHRLVDGETRIGIDNLIAFIDQRQDGVEHDGLSAGDNHHFIGRDRDAARAAYVIGNGLAQSGQAGGGTVMGPALVQRIHGRFHHVGWRVEIGLSDLQVNDALALGFERLGLVQNFKGSFRAQPGHAAGEAQFVLSRCWHND